MTNSLHAALLASLPLLVAPAVGAAPAVEPTTLPADAPVAAPPSPPADTPAPASTDSTVRAAVAPTPAPVSAVPTAPLEATPPSVSSETPEKCAPCGRREPEGAGAFLVGGAVLDLSSLNDHLHANGYQRLPAALTLIGFEGHGVFESGFVAGVHAGALLTPSRSGPGGLQTHFSGGFGALDLGVALLHTQRLLLTLTANIGGYGTTLDIGDDQTVAFDDALRDPRRSASLSRGGLLTGLTLGFDVRVPLGSATRDRPGFFSVGVRIAGLYGPGLGDWGLGNGSKASSGPSSGLTGGYAALALGFGRYR